MEMSQKIRLFTRTLVARQKVRCGSFSDFIKKNDTLPPTKDNLIMTQAICRLCRKGYKNTGNTTNFQCHIDNEHKLHTPAAPRKEKSDKQNAATPASNSSSKQITLDKLAEMKFSLNNKLGIERKKEIDQALIKMMAGKVLPFSLVDNTYFKGFIHTLEPRYLLPSRRTLMDWLQQKKDEIEQKLLMEIKKCEGVAITHDSWTSVATESYNTTTVHFIDDQWELNSAVLGTIKVDGAHTADNIASSLLEVKAKWALPECIATTDNAANEQKAFRILQWKRFGCYGHRLNLIVKNALEVKEIARILGKGRRLVTFFHTSASANDKLMEKQKVLQIKGVGHKLMSDVATRWNSTLDMLERLLEQMPALMAVATDESASKHIRTTVQNCLFTFDESLLAERIVALLKPFQTVTTIVCSEKNPTINKVLPAVTKLKRSLQEADDDPQVIKSMKRRMSEQLDARTEVEDQSISLLGCILSPYTKDFTFCPSKKAEAEELLKSNIKGITIINIKQEKVDEPDQDVPAECSNQLVQQSWPDLPSLDLDFENNHEDQSTNVTKSTPETEISQSSPPILKHEATASANDQPPKKKIKSADYEDWLEDVLCIGESKIDTGDHAVAEFESYLNCAVNHSDSNLTTLQWWQKNEMFFPRISKLAKKILAVQASSVPSERVFSLAGELISKKRSRMSHENVDMFIFLNKNLRFF